MSSPTRWERPSPCSSRAATPAFIAAITALRARKALTPEARGALRDQQHRNQHAPRESFRAATCRLARARGADRGRCPSQKSLPGGASVAVARAVFDVAGARAHAVVTSDRRVRHMTHYIPPFTERVGRQERAFCGALVSPRAFSTEPQCVECARLLVQDAADLAALEARPPSTSPDPGAGDRVTR